jgi:hypothetical protein
MELAPIESVIALVEHWVDQVAQVVEVLVHQILVAQVEVEGRLDQLALIPVLAIDHLAMDH